MTAHMRDRMRGGTRKAGHVDAAALLRLARDGSAEILPSGAFLLNTGQLFTAFGNPTEHGASAYGNHGCRCASCCEAVRLPDTRRTVKVDTRALRECMDVAGLNGRQLAEHAGISEAYVSQILNEHRRPTDRVLRRIANALG